MKLRKTGGQKKRLLRVELIPSTAWGRNIHTLCSQAEWDHLRRAAYRRAGYHCVVCGEQGPKHPVEAHEIWDFDHDTWTQRLVDIIALCPMCHLATHLGRAQMIGRYEEAVQHIKRVNKWSDEQIEDHLLEVQAEWEECSSYSWELDLSKFVR